MNVDVSRNWSDALSRIGFGSIFLYIVLSIEFLRIDSISFGADFSDFGNVSSVLIQAFSFFAMTTVIGGGILSVGHGSLNFIRNLFDNTWADLSEERMLLRAQKIHELGNPFLASEFRDGRLQVSVAAGLLGNLISLFPIVLILVLLFWLPTPIDPVTAKRSVSLTELIGIEGNLVVSLIVILFFFLSIIPASNKFRRIDAVLFRNDT